MSNLSESCFAALEPQLLLRPAPSYLEGPQGYWLRLAERNRMTLGELKKIGANFTIEWLIANGLLAETSAESQLCRYVEIIGGATKKRIWNDRFARFCPLCLLEKPNWQVGWELLFHDVCAHHGVWLIDLCSRCGDWIKPKRHCLLKCQCNADLRDEEARPAPENPRRLSALLVDKLIHGQTGNIPGVLQDLDVEKLQKLIRFLGAHLDPAAGPRPLKIHSIGKMQVSWPVTSQAAEILFRWPAAFHQLLDQIQAAEHEQKKSFSGLFRQTYRYLYKNLEDPSFHLVRAAFQDWVSESWKGNVAKRNLRLPVAVVGNPAWISGGAAAAHFGISMGRLRHMVRTGQLEGEETVSQSGRQFLMIKREQKASLAEYLAANMNQREAMEALALGKKRACSLFPLLFPSANHANDNPNMPWCVPREEVEMLISIGEDLPMVDDHDVRQVTLAHVLRFWTWAVEEVAELIRAVRDGTLMPTAVLGGLGGISRWIFEAEELRTWRLARSQNFSEWLTIEVTARTLGTHVDVVRWLLESGLLKAKQIPTIRAHGKRVHRSEVDEFRSRYIFAVEIAKDLSMTSRELRLLLASYGISPVGAGEAKPCRQLIYRRDDQLADVVRRTLLI